MGQALMIRRGSNGDGNPIGTIIYSAKTDMGDDYLLCNGDQILESNGYGELIDVLGEDKYYTYNDDKCFIFPEPKNDKVYKLSNTDSGIAFSVYNNIQSLLNNETPIATEEKADYKLDSYYSSGEDIDDNVCVFGDYIFFRAQDRKNYSYYKTSIFRVSRSIGSTVISPINEFKSYSDTFISIVHMTCNDKYMILGEEVTSSNDTNYGYRMRVYNTSLTETMYTDDSTKVSDYGFNKCLIGEKNLMMQCNGSGSISGGYILYTNIESGLSTNTSLSRIGYDGYRNSTNYGIEEHGGYIYTSYRPSSSNGHVLRVKNDFSAYFEDCTPSDRGRFFPTYDKYFNKDLSDNKFLLRVDTDVYYYLNATNDSTFKSATETILSSYYIPNKRSRSNKILANSNKIYFINNFDRSATLPTLTPGDNLYAYIKAR